jgi:hypothetical protein
MPADSFVGIWKFIARRNICVAPACVKPPPRCTQAGDSTSRQGNGLKKKCNFAMYNAPNITAETINCMGCRADGAKFAHCNECEIRKCVYGKGFNTCGDCKELDTCQIVGFVIQNVPGAKENLLN